MRCPSCSTKVPDGSRFCGECGAGISATSAGTATAAGPQMSSVPSIDDARFLPGSMVENRYRIIGLLGRGGMGEVYRADDLKLGQPVALKFLPVELSGDEGRLNRLLNEVKIARQVSHPNVCRVYDIGEADGHHYLSMEYVDGEDLSTLLRRIGRLPEDKAVQIARQLCAGLAAAHELGILHRDIKPANVMLDGRGRAKLTDFGLAGLAQGFRDGEVRAGTPTYMAPEQLAGKEVSARSDIYSLGLVLYEVFTGKRAFDADSVAELTRKQLETTPTSPSSFMSSFDPAVERVILQCLEKDPGQRPANALAVAAALPGGDPLAAALAAGETPSPEMVAAAGPQGSLRPAIATTCLIAVVLTGLLGVSPIRNFIFIDHLPLPRSYEVLKEDARDIARKLGYDESSTYTWAGFGFDALEWVHLSREEGPSAVATRLALPGQQMVWMDYRQRDDPIVTSRLNGRVSWSSPPHGRGEVAIEVDLAGRLNVLQVTPAELERSDAGKDELHDTVDWAHVFELAGLDITRFSPVEPTVRPSGFADTRLAWTGTLPEYADRPVRIEAASLDGKPTAFRKIISSDPRWSAERDGSPFDAGAFTATFVILLFVLALVLGGALFLTLRNLRLGRGDRKGAFRVAIVVFAMRTLQWSLGGDHTAHPDELIALVIAISGATTLGVLAWIIYVACEPYLRRLWPQTMIGWTRALSGRLRDPLVGRDVLVGCASSMVQGWIGMALLSYGVASGVLTPVPANQYLIVLRGGRHALGEIFAAILVSAGMTLVLVAMLLFLRLILRTTLLAGAATCILVAGFYGTQFLGLFGQKAGLLIALTFLSLIAVQVLTLARFGLLALVSAQVSGALGNLSVPLFDTTKPYFTFGLFITALGFALAFYGWKVSLAGQPLMHDDLMK